MSNDDVSAADLLQSADNLFLRQRRSAVGIDREPGNLVSHFLDLLQRLGIIFTGRPSVPVRSSTGSRLHRLSTERYFTSEMLQVRSPRQSVDLPVAAND